MQDNNIQNPDICPVCKTTREEILESGYAGCDNCYSFFKNELSHVIKKIHGNNYYTGRAPAWFKFQERLDSLNRDMKIAVAMENYEEAAGIRDKIKSLLKKGGESNDKTAG